jgi:Cu(I)/Ag(I) efflux system membrane protein CusA/SilA
MMPSPPTPPTDERLSLLDQAVWFCLTNKVVVVLAVLCLVTWGFMVAPFDFGIQGLPRDPIAVDAIPDTGENQQIVFTEWPGRSPQDIEDQVTYPLTTALLGTPGVDSVRSFSFFGFSSVHVIFGEKVDFYWARSRILEKLNSLPQGTLPTDVQPTLGPDATALGQVFWYTLEGRDPEGQPIGGWDLHELRSIQDWQVHYALLASEGVSEAASVGGFVQEYQVDVDPDAMRTHRVTLDEVLHAVQQSNVDVSARTIEVNKVEYVIRGLGYIKNLADIELAVIRTADNVPISIRDVARVSLGPALRRGALDKGGAEAVGGVVVARYGANPMAVIENTKSTLRELAPSLPTKAVVFDRTATRETIEAFATAEGFAAYAGIGLNQDAWLPWLSQTPRMDWPAWITTSQVTVVPFYDRSGLIQETLGTLSHALTLEILITIIVVLLMVMHLRSAVLVSGVLPLAVLMCFIAMKLFSIDANIVALTGIAIAVGTLVDMGVIVCENILRKQAEADTDTSSLHTVFEATREVSGAVFTAVCTTVISFLPVFTLTAAEGRLFRPLAYTKTFVLISSVIVALFILPAFAHMLTRKRASRPAKATRSGTTVLRRIVYTIAVATVAVWLSDTWLPLGPERGVVRNLLFVGLCLGGVLLLLFLVRILYVPILRVLLRMKLIYLAAMALLVVFGAMAWLGADSVFRGALPAPLRGLHAHFPGLGKEFMPPLDEGSFLFMPSTMPHASIGEALDVLQHQDRAIAAIPEVESVVGKIGRVESAIDPAPIGMIETVVNYLPEYKTDASGMRLRFAYDSERAEFDRDDHGELIPDESGRPYRQWRESFTSPTDIWDEITRVAAIPGTTAASMLQPIETRRIMLQTGLRAPMGVKLKGPSLEAIDEAGLAVERLLKDVPGVRPETVFADRIVGKPYLEINIDREAIARHGITIQAMQDVIEVAIGGRSVTTTVEGRERYAVRVRYLRELRDRIETLGQILVPASNGAQIPLAQLAAIQYVRGAQSIKSEDGQLVGYVLFDKQPDRAEVNVVESCQTVLAESRANGTLLLPAGVTYSFTGSYENQLRAQKTLRVVLPLALILILLILYFQFRSLAVSSLVFSTIIVAWSGGFLLLWLYGQPWFMDVNLLGVNMRTLFHIDTVNLSVAVWVGFLALFGIASDDGVVITTYLNHSFARNKPTTKEEVRAATVEGAARRIRPCLITTGTTLLALIPILTSTGRGSDIMIPMAIPTFGGMLVVIATVFLVPVLYCGLAEVRLWFEGSKKQNKETQQ